MACVAFDGRGIIAAANSAADTLLKTPLTQLAQHPFSEFLSATSTSSFQKHLKDLYKEAKTQTVDLKIKRGNDDESYLRLFSTPDTEQKPPLYYGILMDVTREVNLTLDMLREHERLSFHVENSPLALNEYDHDFRIRSWSHRAEKPFG